MDRKEAKNRLIKEKGINVNVKENIATPILPTTRYYIKSWGYFNKQENIHIEQLEPFRFFYNINGKKGIAQVKQQTETKNDEVIKLGLGFVAEGKLFLFKKSINEAKLFYNIPSVDLVNLYLDGKYKPRSYSELSLAIKKSVKELFDFEELDLETTNLFIGQTWLKPLSENFFFYMIDSTFGGGKTTLGEIVYFLSRHGFVGGDISAPAIPRLVDDLDLNIYVDELDQSLKDDNIQGVLRKGQRRGNPYVRCEGRDNRPVAYEVAGCHGGSYRSELEDAFMNRSLRVHTIKSQDHMLGIVNSVKREVLKPLADELFIWHLDHIVATCSEEEGVAVKTEPTTFSRNGIYEALTKDFSEKEKQLLLQLFGRDSELTYLCLKTAKLLGLDVIDAMMEIIAKRKEDEASSENFYNDSLRALISSKWLNIQTKRLHDGLDSGKPFYPKNALYRDFVESLRQMNVATIGTKRFSSMLRDFGFVEGISIKSQRYGDYPSPCLIFREEICKKLSLEAST